MEIKLTKTGGNPVLACKRKDGSVTWRHVIPFFIGHDLCHYAVETIIPLKKAFWGMIAGGIDISDFDLPKEERNFQLTEEAILAEHLVNLLTIELSQGKMENLLEVSGGIYQAQVGTNFYKIISEKKLEAIRERINTLMQQWQALSDTETMTLLFED